MAAIWNIARAEDSYPPLQTDIEVDVAVIGAGITGLTTALQLVQAGKRVAVLEALQVGAGSTGGATGNLYAPLTKGLASIRKKWGDETIREVAISRAAAVSYVEETVKSLAIDCQFERCSLYRLLNSRDDSQEADLEEEFDAMATAGLTVNWVDESPLPFPIHHGLRLDNQAQFNPLRYVQGLARAVVQLGGSLYEHSQVEDIDYDRCVLKTATAQVTARHIVHATHTPKGINLLQAGMQPAREYGVSARLGNQAYPQGIIWVAEPFHSIRSYRHAGQDYLVVIGEKHKTGEGELGAEYYDRLKDYLRDRFGVTAIEHQWSAQQYSSADGLPYIGRRHGSEHAYLATGFAGDGLTWGTLAGQLLSDLIRGEQSRWAELYDATRFTPGKSIKEWVSENVSVAKHLAKDYLKPSEHKALAEVGPGEGKLVALDGEKLAVYRSEEGKVSAVSAVCPHMKCLVHWNAADRSWDCPCHGSRFDIDGTLLEGPALHGLAQRTELD